MLISVRRIAATIVSLSRFPPDRSQSRRVLPLLPRSPLATARNPKSVVETLKDHGFTDTQIDAIARKAPWIRSSRSGDLVGAKMSYLCRKLGLDQLDVVKVVTSDANVLRSSLKNTIIPSINYLESMLGSRCRAVIVRAPWLICCARSRVAAIVAMLKDSGVPESSIMKLLLTQSYTLIHHTPERFRSHLDSLKSAEFDPSRLMSVHAIHVKSAMSSSTWARKAGGVPQLWLVGRGSGVGVQDVPVLVRILRGAAQAASGFREERARDAAGGGVGARERHDEQLGGDLDPEVLRAGRADAEGAREEGSKCACRSVQEQAAVCEALCRQVSGCCS